MSPTQMRNTAQFKIKFTKLKYKNTGMQIKTPGPALKH